MLKVVCVLKSGGDYDETYVLALYYAVLRNLTVPFEFLCLSDVPVDCPFIPLNNGWRGWWSKIELFRLKGAVLYLDLDTVIIGNLDPLAETILNMPKDQFLMLRAIHRKRQWASGVMGWNGDFSFIYNHFKYDMSPRKFPWDQNYIISKLLAKKKTIKCVQDYQSGMYSYKRHCRAEGCPPDDATVVYFHGKPRPHECSEPWIKENWA